MRAKSGKHPSQASWRMDMGLCSSSSPHPAWQQGEAGTDKSLPTFTSHT